MVYEVTLDFNDVCWGADMDPEFVRGEYIKVSRYWKNTFY
jgi:hypothetical protein